MRLSQIVIPTPKVVEPEPEDGKIIKAYKEEMARQQLTELELNRTRIRMIDENGQIKKVPLFSEH
ncbi:hypothetical protein ACFFUP_13195 [Vibrio ostreicida]|nr:hypothetical protein [Vibrio ostreicida]NPD09065.1 hypothetical protein [Vibrio ostreicida]